MAIECDPKLLAQRLNLRTVGLLARSEAPLSNFVVGLSHRFRKGVFRDNSKSR